MKTEMAVGMQQEKAVFPAAHRLQNEQTAHGFLQRCLTKKVK